MADRDIRERDILVAPNEYAYVQDLTKGDIVLYVGPTKVSLSNTERMLVNRGGRFEPVRGDEVGKSVHHFIEATSGQYIILQNPPTDPEMKPVKGANSAIGLEFGRTVVVPGPVEFPLWPGQQATVLDGHRLREDEYLVVRLYENSEEGAIGTETIIRGTDSSFYMPQTGLEVVPTPDGKYVRKAWRMENNRGLHLRVTSAFEADGSGALPPGHYRAGQDVFLRGGEAFFFPNERLEVIGEVAAIPLAEKEAIYVRSLDSGKISTVIGPVSYLVDPTKEELVSRFLSLETQKLYGIEDAASDRAPSIYIAPSTAVLVVAPDRREVVAGPLIRVLDFDEELERLTLSTGRPKSDSKLLPTCSLQVQSNRVSDRVKLQTADHVDLQIDLSYRVSFVGDNERWFAVRNYVGLLCDHLGSIIRAAARACSIEEFHRSSADILRNSILGSRADDGERAGRHFTENGMWVYDVEILDVQILDKQVMAMLQQSQRAAIASGISRKQEQLRLSEEELREEVELKIYRSKIATLREAVEFESANRDLETARVGTRLEIERLNKVKHAENVAEAMDISSKAEHAAKLADAAIVTQRMEAEAAAFCQQMQSLQPELISTLRSLGNKKLAGELSKNLAPLAILGGDSVADVASRLLESLPLGSRPGTDLRSELVEAKSPKKVNEPA